jgi:signal peptidase I
VLRPRLLLAAAITALVTALAVLLVGTVGIYRVAGDSMAPALPPGTLVVVERLGTPPGGYRLGELVAFRAPLGWETAGETLVKRVVGLPGDVITIYEGAVHRNGTPLAEPYLSTEATTEARGRRIGEWVLTGNQYFLLGDNRRPSLDSRLFGPVDGSLIIGRLLHPGDAGGG